MTDAMVDLETFGNGPLACVVQIGACYFNRNTGEIGKTFKCNIDARDCVSNGAVIDADTVYWWLAQSSAAITSILDDTNFQDEHFAFHGLNDFLKDAKAVWSHATFDFVIIQNALRRLKIKPLFSYRCARDIRTLMDLAGPLIDDSQRKGIHHNALDDAIFQVEYCVKALNRLRVK